MDVAICLLGNLVSAVKRGIRVAAFSELRIVGSPERSYVFFAGFDVRQLACRVQHALTRQYFHIKVNRHEISPLQL